jgi:DNA-binding MarR family transcriptional regulator
MISIRNYLFARRLVNIVSKRYFLPMTLRRAPAEHTPDEIAEMLVHLGRAARGEDASARLTPAQWTGLRFFARANRASRTPSAFASFHATTRGTASQTVKSLEQKGLLTRTRSEEDRRSVRFELTRQGRMMLRADPLRHLAHAIERLPADERAALASALPALASDLATMRGASAFGTCGDCRHYAERNGGGYCACVAAELAPSEIGQLCANFAAGDPHTADPEETT